LPDIVGSGPNEDEREARKLLRDVVKVLAHAFDEAWASMAHTVEPAHAKKVKSSLARAIVAEARGRAPKDHQALKTAALVSFQMRLGQAPRKLSQPQPHCAPAKHH
jgi:uncharacterized membrane protein